MKTHYDNLQVAQSASQRVIRAAWKSLVQAWHPDKHSHNIQEAERILKIINRAYEVLSNPETRKQHDDWIKPRQETRGISGIECREEKDANCDDSSKNQSSSYPITKEKYQIRNEDYRNSCDFVNRPEKSYLKDAPMDGSAIRPIGLIAVSLFLFAGSYLLRSLEIIAPILFAFGIVAVGAAFLKSIAMIARKLSTR